MAQAAVPAGGGNNGSGAAPPPSTRPGCEPTSACVTRLEPVRLSQHWRVESFGTVVKLSKPGNCLRSQVFRHHGYPDACWQLCLYPGGKRDENANNVSLFLKMSATNHNKEVQLKAEYRFYFLDDQATVRFSNVNIGDFHAKPPKGGHSWGLRNIPRPKVLQSLRDDGSLMILCEIELVPDVNKTSAVSAGEQVSVPRSFARALGTLRRSGAHADCVVAARGGDEFAAHKCLLTAQSAVFDAMFAHADTRESTEGRVLIDDFDSDAVDAFLDYIYTGSATAAAESDKAEELLGLAEKYGVAHLKAACEDALARRVERASVCQLLATADLYGAESLRRACLAFIGARHREVLGGDSWAELKERAPQLANEVLEQLLRQSDGSASLASSPPPKRQRVFV